MQTTHKFRHVWLWPSLLLLLIAAAPALATAQTTPDGKLESAIAALRHIDQSKMTDAQKDQMAHDIDAAWDVIRTAGPDGIARLKKEVQTVDQGSEPDDFFKLNASALLWIIGKLDQVDAIAAIWSSTPLSSQFNYVFLTAYKAAETNDPRALPLLLAVLKMQEGRTYTLGQDLHIGWAAAQTFIWGVYGSQGLPILAGLLQTSKDVNTRRSAIRLLTEASYVKALPAIREIALKGSGDERFQAIRALGEFGDPQDFDFLASGLKPSDPEVAFHYAFAAYEYEDLRAVPLLIALLQDKGDDLQYEVLPALLHLASPASIDALQEFCGRAKNEDIQGFCLNQVQGMLQDAGLDWGKYAKLTAAEKEKLFRDRRQTEEAKYQLQKGDQTLTHPQLAGVLDEWKRLHTVFPTKKMVFSTPDPSKPTQILATTVQYYWVEERHILSVTTPDDADALVDARALVYRILTDDSLNDAHRINVILRRLARSQYRQAAGITEKATRK